MVALWHGPLFGVRLDIHLELNTAADSGLFDGQIGLGLLQFVIVYLFFRGPMRGLSTSWMIQIKKFHGEGRI